MSSDSILLLSSSKSAHTGRLPLEVTDLCILYFLEGAERRKAPRDFKREITPLRLVCKHLEEVVSGKLFGHVTLRLLPDQARARAFLDIVRNRKDNILKHVRHITLEFKSKSDFPSPSPTVTGLVAILAKAPFRTLTISGLRAEQSIPVEHNALQQLRCGPNLENLVVCGGRVTTFMVCGHIGSTPLKSIDIQVPYPPFHKLYASSSAFEEGSMILGNVFQPLAKLQHLSLIKPDTFPKYFPLHDFGSTYYPSNGRIPASFPSLKTLRAGNHLKLYDVTALGDSDYNVLATLLPRAPQLEELFVVDDFLDHDGSNTFFPLAQQLPAMVHLKQLTLEDFQRFGGRANGDTVLSALCNLITTIPAPIPALRTLSLRVEWPSTTPDITRLDLYFSKVWMQLGQVLRLPTLASLRRFILNIDIQPVEPEIEDPDPEISNNMDRGELDVLEETLAQGISGVLGGSSKLRVEVGITFNA